MFLKSAWTMIGQRCYATRLLISKVRQMCQSLGALWFSSHHSCSTCSSSWLRTSTALPLSRSRERAPWACSTWLTWGTLSLRRRRRGRLICQTLSPKWSKCFSHKRSTSLLCLIANSTKSSCPSSPSYRLTSRYAACTSVASCFSNRTWKSSSNFPRRLTKARMYR